MSQDNATVDLETDNPLESPDNDTLHRSAYCKALADTLANRKDADSLAIGITGN